MVYIITRKYNIIALRRDNYEIAFIAEGPLAKVMEKLAELRRNDKASEYLLSVVIE